MTYAQPGQEGSVVSFKSRYDNFIGGEWVAPADGLSTAEQKSAIRRRKTRPSCYMPGGVA